jgi:hypothetical protein
VTASIQEFLDGIVPATRKRDAATMLDLMQRVTGQPPELSRSAIGFGSYDYEYESGRKGTASAAGFAPRKSALVVYVMDGVSAHRERLARLGPHTETVGCIYIKDLEAVDLSVLEEIVRTSYTTLTNGTYTLRARDGGKS